MRGVRREIYLANAQGEPVQLPVASDDNGNADDFTNRTWVITTGLDTSEARYSLHKIHGLLSLKGPSGYTVEQIPFNWGQRMQVLANAWSIEARIRRSGLTIEFEGPLTVGWDMVPDGPDRYMAPFTESKVALAAGQGMQLNMDSEGSTWAFSEFMIQSNDPTPSDDVTASWGFDSVYVVADIIDQWQPIPVASTLLSQVLLGINNSGTPISLSASFR